MQDKKIIYITRGLPGSGKSTLAKQLTDQNNIIYSTDDYFMVDGKYIYDPKMIPQYHRRNQQRTRQAMIKLYPIIIVDNTNIKLWQMKSYVKLADQFNYQIKIIQPNNQWSWDPSQCAKRNGHGVPYDIIQRMKMGYQKFNNIDQIRNSQQPIRKGRGGRFGK